MKSFTIQLLIISTLLFLLISEVKGQENIASLATEIKTSYVSSWETLNAISDGYEPSNSADKGLGAYGNWNTTSHFNEWNWVEYDFSSYYLIDQSAIYWWADGLGIKIPYETYLEYWNIYTGEWERPSNLTGNGVLPDQYNVTTFDPVITNKIRVNFVSLYAEGILEWKVFGTLEENVPASLTVISDVALSVGTSTTFTLTAKDSNGNGMANYSFYLIADIVNGLTTVNETYQINGIALNYDSLLALPITDADGMTTVKVVLPAIIDPTDGISLKFTLQNKNICIKTQEYFSEGMTSPILIADNSQNDVDHCIEIQFADDPTWRSQLDEIIVNGISLPDESYDILPGIISLKSGTGFSVLSIAGTKEIVIKSKGYKDCQVSQPINSGSIDATVSYLDSTVKFYRPSKVTIPVFALDKYGNPISNYSFHYDIEYVNNDLTTSEDYVVGNVEIAENSTGNLLSPTDSTGKAYITLSVPQIVDVNDGILFQLKLNDNETLVGTPKGYLHQSTERDVYFPTELKRNTEFSWEKTAQSEHFTAFWGAKTGTDPLNPLAGSSFNVQDILSELEGYYSYYVDSMKFILNPDSLNMGKYKFVIILFDTWKSGYTSTGTAYGGSVDDVIGAMWMSPMSGFVIAHEFGHACQAMIPIQYPNKGFKNKDDNHQVGMYWEACANYMAYLSTGQTGNMITPLFMNTSMLQYLSTIDYRQYESIYLPAYIIDKYGIEALGKQWRNAEKGDNPFDAMMRGLGMTRDEMRREAGLWAMHNVTWDYSIGSLIRSTLNSEDISAVCREYTYLQTINGIGDTYIVPREMAPADYGYNIIPMFPNEGVTTITAKLTGYDNESSGGGGWSYGFVAVDADGNPRYGDVALETDGQAIFSIEPTDSLFYLVVTGTPVNTNTYAWTPNWTRVYRFPYSLQFENALPAGQKDGYNSKKSSVIGASHSNGGGWVASTATVDASAYVGPNAQVLETAKVTGTARIEDYAIVQGTSQVKGNAVIRGNAIVGNAAVISDNAVVEKSARVWGGKISGNGVVTGSAVAFTCKVSGDAVIKDVAWVTGLTISGTTIVGGDIISFVTCDEGVYLSQNQSSCSGVLWHTKYIDDINSIVDKYDYPFGDIPQHPDNIQADALDGTSIVLTWDEALDNGSIVNYIVFQDGKAIHLATGTSDTITGLNPETAYIFTLRARDNAGNISEESTEIQVNTLVSNNQLGKDKFGFSLKPNPATEYFTIEPTGIDQAEVTIVNLAGEVVYHSNFLTTVTLDRSSVEKSGIYFVKVKSGNNVQVKKLIIR